MALRDRLEELQTGVFADGQELVTAFYKEYGLEVEFDQYAYQDGYTTWQVDSKFDDGRAEGTIYPMHDIVAWGFRKLIEGMVGGV